ncbi:hypothetical protein Tco_1298498, partial [Tanacetum coccineum]
EAMVLGNDAKATLTSEGQVRGQPRRGGVDGGGGEEEPQPHRRDQWDLKIAAQGRRIRELERLLAVVRVDAHRDFNHDGDRVSSSDGGDYGGFDTESPITRGKNSSFLCSPELQFPLITGIAVSFVHQNSSFL